MPKTGPATMIYGLQMAAPTSAPRVAMVSAASLPALVGLQHGGNDSERGWVGGWVGGCIGK